MEIEKKEKEIRKFLKDNDFGTITVDKTNEDEFQKLCLDFVKKMIEYFQESSKSIEDFSDEFKSLINKFIEDNEKTKSIL